MPLVLNVSEAESVRIIVNKFNFLLRLFNFNPDTIAPNKIEVNIIDSVEEFLEIYRKEYKCNPPKYVVGFAASNGKIFVLNKNQFEKRGHLKSDFEKVLVHELCHIFIRRILDPKHTFRWIEEGLCQYIAFKGREFKVRNFIDFKKLETKEDWKKHPAYQQSAKFFEFLDKKFGMAKIVAFIKLIRFKKEYDAFKEIFGEEFDFIQKEFIKYLNLKNDQASSRNTL